MNRRILSLLLVISILFTSLITPSMAFALEASTDEAVIEEPTMESNVIKQEEKPEEKPAVDTNGTSKGAETQPTEDPKGTQPTEAPEETQPTEAPEETQPTEAPEETQPTEAPEETQPTEAPEETQPTEAPEETQPTEAPEETQPTEAPEETQPTEAPEETQPTEAPEETQPTDNSVPAQNNVDEQPIEKQPVESPTNDDKNTNTEVFQESVRPGASILSIITPPVATHTYTFVSEGKTIESQIIKNGESLIEPEAPSITNKKFVGWYIEPPTDTTPGVKAQFDTPITVTSTQEITVTAVYKEVVYIYFWHDDTNDGISNFTVISTKEIIPGNKTDGSNVPVVTWPGKVFSHWSLTEGGPAFEFENTPITENTNLYSVLDDKWTVDFDSEGGSTVPLQNVTDGLYATAPTAPTKAGYTFSHWSIAPNGSAFNFSTTSIKADTTLYAVWTTTQAKYTVVYWIQNPNDDGYSIVKVQDMTGSTGADATYTSLNDTFETSFSSKYKINQTKTDASKVKIAGDGSTVRNVYYDRQVYTLNIEIQYYDYYYGYYYWSTVSTTQFKYGQKTDSAYYSAMNQYPGYLWYVSRTSSTAYGEAPDMPNRNLTISGRYSGDYKYITHYREKVGTSEVTIHPDFIYFAGSRRIYTIEDGIAIKGFTVVTPVTEWKQFTWNNAQNTYVGTIYYTRNNYNISFQKNDGTAATTVSGIPYEADISTKSLAGYVAGQTTMVRDGVTYTFDGWYDNKALVGDPYNFSGKKMPAEDLLLYAKWTAPVYKVNFHETMQITSAITETQEVNRLGTATDIGLPETIPPGATAADFKGWYWFYEGNLVKYDFESPVIQDVDLFPVWGNITFNVTYDLNGGQGSVLDSSDYEFSSYAYIKPITGVTPPEGKVFLGWKKADGTLIHPGDKVQILGDVNLKAVWGPAPTDTQITYDPNGGVESPVVIPLVNNGIHTVNNNTFTREGYVFRGWNTNPDGSGTPFKPEDQILVDRINENTNVLYAQWEALIDLKSVKSWNAPAGYNYPDIWFTLIRVNKDGSETTIETKQVPNTSPYEVLWQGLERTDGTGYTYIYKVKETDASGTDFTPLNFKKIESGLNVTNNFVPISITGTKVWSENSPEDKPTITFKLQQSTDGVNFTDYGLNGTPRTIVNGSTTAIWEDLPEFYAPGQKYIYKVIEDNPPESYTVEQTDNLTITNTFVDTTYTVTKVWDYGESGTPPEGEVRPPIQLQLYQDGKPYGSYVQVENQTALTYEHTWEGLPKYKKDGTEHIYTARELAIPDHYQMTWDAATNTITNTYREDSFTASKIWVGEQPAVGTVVKVQLYQLIKPDDPNYDANYKVAIGDPVTLVGPDWAHTWQGLSTNGTHSGKLVNFEYAIEEVAPFPDGYYYDAVSSASIQVTNVSETTSFTANKTWINGPIPHQQVTLYLERKQEGQPDSEFTKVDGSDYILSPSETRHTWSGLDSYAQWSDTDKTQRIKWVYRVRELPVENYTTTYPDNQSVVNNYVPPSDGTATATKIWSGGKPEDHVRPSFTLWRRMPGGLIEVVPETEFTLEVTPSDPQATSTEFVFTWTGLQTKDEHGDEIQYGFQENPVPNGYSLSFTGQSYTDPETGATWGYSGSTAQNTYIVPKNATFTANKTWVNGPTKDHNQVYLQLWRTIDVDDSTKLEKVAADVHPTVVFDEATHTYAYTWENLESTDNDANPYTYFFTEEVVPGYTRTYSSSQMFDGTEYGVDGSTVTNEYVIPTDGKAEATKKFVNGSTDTHIAPTMTLWRELSDGTLEKVEASAVITGTAPTFYYSWTGLERTDSNGYEYEFYFTEDNVPVNYELTYTSTLEKDGKLYGYNGAIAENKYKSPSREVTAYKQWVNGSATDYYAVPLKLWRTTNPGVGPVEEVIANYSVTESTTPGRYEYVWTNLPENDDQGKPYIYYFTESEQDNYKREYSSPSTIESIEYGLTGTDQGVSNTYISPKGTITGDKEWVFGNQESRPEVFMKLYRSINADGSALEAVPEIDIISLKDAEYIQVMDVNVSYLTQFSWENIDLNAPDGQSYYFFVKEVDVNGADYTPEHYSKLENRQSVVNIYQATGTLTPEITKILNGRSLTEGEFTFQLIELTDSTDENGDLVTTETVIGKTANTADGLVQFEALSFDQTDIDKTKTYIIREVKPDPVEKGMVYGDDISLVVSITDPGNNDGTLTITPSYSSEQQVVINTYTATGTFTPAPTKVLDGRILTDGEFTFNLLDVDETVLQTKANKADGTIPFEAIAYTQEDIGKTFTYTVKEVIPDPTESGMAYDPMEITYTVEVTDGGNGVLTITPVLPEDTEFNNIFTPNPSFKVDKSADKDSFKTAGETIIYTITVENTGNVPIDNLKVEDSKFDLTQATLSGDEGTVGVLDVGEVWIYTYTYTTTDADVEAGKIENVVTVTDPDDPDNPGEDTEIVPTTSFTVTKSANKDSFKTAGEEIVYTITITNTGNGPIDKLDVSDSKFDLTEATLAGDTNSNTILDVGEVWTYTYTYTTTDADVEAGKIENVVTVTDPDDPDNPGEDTEIVPTTSFTVTKSANKDSFKTAGEEIVYTITITNTGNGPIDKLDVSDSKFDLTEATLAGDTNSNTILDVGEVWTYTYTYTTTDADVEAGKIENVVTVTDPDDPDNPGEDTEIVPTTSFTVTKSANKDSFKTAGEEIVYTITITNTGNGPIDKLDVSDSKFDLTEATLAGDTNSNTILDVGEVWTYTYTYTTTDADVEAGKIENVVTVTDPDDPDNPGEDTEIVPTTSFTVTKSANKDSFKTAGEEIVYTITITNTGNGPIDKLDVSDSKFDLTEATLAGDTNSNTILDVGEVWTYTYTYTTTDADVEAGKIENVVTVTDPDDPDNPGEDTEIVPTTSFTVTKSANKDSFKTAGEEIVYTITITNTGNGPIDKLDVSDSKFDLTEATLAGDTNSNTILDVGEVWTYTYTYTTTDADVEAGKIENVVTVTDPDDPDNPGEDTEIVPTTSFTVTKSANKDSFKTAGEEIVYTITITNTGNGPIDKLDVSDSKFDLTEATLAGDTNSNTILDVGEVWTYTYTYTTTDADVEAGKIENVVTVTDPDDPDNPGEDTEIVPTTSFTVTKSANKDSFKTAGEEIVYTITITNTGNGPIDKLDVSDSKFDLTEATLAGDTNSNTILDVGEVWTYTYTYTTTDADVEAGKIENVVTVTDPDDPDNPGEDTEIVPTTSFTVTKSANKDSFKTAGEEIVYTITITNTGNGPIDKLDVSDSKFDLTEATLAGDTNSNTILDVGEVWTYTYTYTTTDADVEAGKIENVVTVTDPDDPDNPGEDTEIVPTTSFTVTKSANKDSFKTAGEEIVYTITITNTGNGPIDKLDVSDSKFDLTEATLAGDTNSNTILDVGEVWTYTYTYTTTDADVEAGKIENVVTVTDPDDPDNPGEDTEIVPTTSFTVTKSANKDSFKTAGEEIVYTITITNTGNGPIDKLDVSDSKFDLTEATLVGDTNSNTILDVGEVWTYTYTYTTTDADVEAGKIENVVTVTDPDDPDNPGEDTEIVPTTSFTVTKSANKDSFKTAGEEIVYTITITNTGNGPIDKLDVSDSKFDLTEATLVGDTNSNTILDVGEVWTYTYTYTTTDADVEAGKIENVVTVTDPDDPDNPGEDTEIVPTTSFTVTKSANKDSFKTAGEEIVYTITITNTGNGPIDKLDVSDSKFDLTEATLAGDTNSNTILDVGEVWTYTYTYTTTDADVEAGKIENVVTVTDPDDPDNPGEDTEIVPTTSFTVTKSANKDSFKTAGEEIVYTITITNTGNGPIDKLDVSDSKFDLTEATLVGDTNSNTILDVGEVWTYTYTYTTTDADVEAGKIENVVTVTDPDDPDNPGEDTEIVPTTSFTVTKSANKDSFKTAGEEIVYTITITNTGNGPIDKLDVSDSKFDLTEATLAGDTNSNTILDVGEVWTYTYTYTTTDADVEAGKIENVVTVTDPDDPDNPGEDTEIVPTTSFTVTKSANKDSFKTAGEEIVYTITITNTGNGPIDKLDVSDSKFDLTEATLAGDTNSNTILDVGEVWTYTYTYTTTDADVEAGKIENVVTVTDPDDPDNPGEDTEIVPTTSFTVTKSANKDSFKTAGEEIVYTITITNTGNGPIDKLDVSDSKFDLTEATLVGDTNSNTILDVGEVWTYTYTYTTTDADVEAGKIENVVTVTDPDDPDNPGEDKATTNSEKLPAMTVVKTAGKTSYSVLGEEVPYTVVVTNTGNITLKDLTVTDSLVNLENEATLVESVKTDGMLQVGETWTYTYKYRVTQADLDKGSIYNLVTVKSPDPDVPPVEDDEEIEKLVTKNDTPSISISKIAKEKSFKKVGDKLTYSVVIKNTGNVDITSLTVIDSLVDLSKIAPVESITSDKILQVGETWTYNYTYVVTEADEKAGKVVNKVTAKSPQLPNEPSVSHTIPKEPSVPPKKLPMTGSGSNELVLLGGALLIGLGFLTLRKKKKTIL